MGKQTKDEEGVAGEISKKQPDAFFDILHKLIRTAVRILAVLMVFVIYWAVADVIWVLYEHFSAPPYFVSPTDDIVRFFAGFLAVLIAIEVFINITLYLRDDAIHVQLVVATALMAVARKVIVMDYNDLSPAQLWAMGILILAVGATYWVVAYFHKGEC